MENEQQNSLPDFDSNYIDQLFSAGRNAPKPAPAPAPAPAESEPAPEAPEPVPEEPAEAEPPKALPRSLLLLAAVVLLGVGFLLGRLTAPNPDPNPDPGTTRPDYGHMTTDRLVSIAVQIPELSQYGSSLTMRDYTELKLKETVLLELELRQDAVEQLTLFALSNPDTAASQAAHALIRHYINNLGHSPVTDPTDPGIEMDYASMSTQELVQIAIQTPGLSGYGRFDSGKVLTINVYTGLKRNYPVLAELEHRPDATEQLNLYIALSDPDTTYAAHALLRYYVVYLGFENAGVTAVTPACQWYHKEDGYTRVYEYTEAPQVTEISSGGEQNTLFDFQGALFVLKGQRSSVLDANFWYRIEWVRDNSDDQLSSMPNPVLGWRGESSWVDWQSYDGGWFIYGYASAKTDITFTISLSGTSHHISLTVSPVPPSGSAPSVYAQSILDQAATLFFLSLHPDNDFASYPIVAALLEQPGGISALLNLARATNGPRGDVFYSNPLPSLLSTSAFTDRMTTAESDALHLLCGDSNIYLDLYDLSQSTVSKTADGFVLVDMPDYRVGDKPEALKNVPLSKMNYWAYVPLTEGAAILRQPDWNLEIGIVTGGAGPLGAWPVYDSTDALVGWVVSGELTEACTLQFRLLQGENALYHSSFNAQPLAA